MSVSRNVTTPVGGCPGGAETCPSSRVAGIASAGSWARIARSRSRSRSPGLDAQLLNERPAGVLVGLQRFGLAVRAVERQHLLGAETLAVGVLGDQGLELIVTSAWRPSDSLASISCSSAARRRSSRRATSGCANGS